MPNAIDPSRRALWSRRVRMSSLVTAASLLSACLAPAPGMVVPAETPAAPTPAVPAASTGWELLAPGLERQTLRPSGSAFNSFLAIRIDPALYTFRAHYLPGGALTAADWRDALPGAAVFANANFFTPELNVLGLLVSDGVPFGSTFVGRGGMFQVASGVPRVRSLIAEPYAGETLEQAVQAFPMLMVDGQPAIEQQTGDRPSRRTVIAQDANGRVLLIVSNSLFGLRLSELSAWLATSELGLVQALNLDGGGSSLLGVNLPVQQLIPSFDPVPAVLAAYPREGTP